MYADTVPGIRSQSRVDPVKSALVLVLLGGAALTTAGFLPWTSRGLGSTQTLLELSNLAGSGLIDDRWISPMLLVAPLIGTITIVLASMALASRDLRLDRRRLRVIAGALLGMDVVAVVVTASIVHALRDRPLHVPGTGFFVGAAATVAIGLGAGALRWRPGTRRAQR